jgi:hypothetical protein
MLFFHSAVPSFVILPYFYKKIAIFVKVLQ